MSDDEDLVDDIEAEVDDVAESPVFRAHISDVDARRRLEAKLEEVRLRKMTQDYDF